VTDSDGAGPLPDLVVIGVAKAGTTSLFRYLAQHPDVCPSDVKELRYFSTVRYGEPLPPLADYRRHFAHCTGERYRMEATPGYYAGGRRVADAMAELLPGARVVVSFRDPVQRCWSWFRFVRSTARIPKDMSFADYVDRCLRLHEEGTDGTRANQAFWGVGGGCYDTWFEPWREVFGDRFRVEFFEDVIHDPRSVVEGLASWLEIDVAACAGFRYGVENKTVQYKLKGLQKAALAVNRRSERFFAAHPELKSALRGAYYKLNSDAVEPRMDDATRERLGDFYAPHTERLAALLVDSGTVDVPDWLTAARRV
jgi:hypothetical protein